MQGTKYRTQYRLVLIPLIFALTACGSKASGVNGANTGLASGLSFDSRQNATIGVASDQLPGNTTSGTGTDPFGSSNPTPTPTPAPVVVRSGAAPIPFEIRGIGYDGITEITVHTRDVLKVVFIPETQDRTVSGTGFSAAYSALAVDIGVEGESNQFTPLVSNGSDPNYPQQASPIIDFSSSVEPCPATDTTCVRTVKLSISKPNYNYWAFVWNQLCFYDSTNNNGYCTDHTNVYKTHPWHGTLWVETSYTRSLKTGVNP